MKRIPLVTPPFTASRLALGIAAGTPASQALGATINAICEADELPGLLDLVGPMPSARTVWVRQVPGHALWVWYDVFRDTHVWLLTLTSSPPPLA